MFLAHVTTLDANSHVCVHVHIISKLLTKHINHVVLCKSNFYAKVELTLN